MIGSEQFFWQEKKESRYEERYEIEAQRAVKGLDKIAEDPSRTVQLELPLAEMVGWLRQSVDELVRQAGVQLVGLLLEAEVKALVGERSQPQPERTANRWGSVQGYCVVMGQKVPITRPRVRGVDDREVPLGSYE